MFHKPVSLYSLKFIEMADTAKLRTMYKKVLLKIKRCDGHIWFNIQCKKRRVFPNYIHINCKSTTISAIKAVQSAKWKWLNNEIRRWFAVKQNLRDHAKYIHLELSYKLHQVEFDILDNKIRELCFVELQKIMHKKFNKLQMLETKSQQGGVNVSNGQPHNEQLPHDNNSDTEITFFPRVTNRTKITFTTEELKMMEKGIKYSPTCEAKFKDYINLAVDTEICTNKFDLLVKSECAQKIKSSLEEFRQTVVSDSREKTIIKSIKHKIDSNNLILTKADKGNTLVILHEIEYTEKMYEFISESGAVQSISDPTSKFQLVIRNAIKNYSILENQKLINMNPKAPIIYGLLKLHKVNCPIRPVVAYKSAPAYNLCKLFNKLFLKFTDFSSKYAIKNSVELIEKIEQLEVPNNSTLVSFDVKSLFPSIPILELREIVYQYIDEKVYNNTIRFELKRVFDIIITQNYFKFNDKYFRLEDGLAMGSPSSPLLAEIFMNHFEKTMFNNNCPFQSKMKFWYRYVDDVLVLWLGTDSELNDFLKWINVRNNRIQFTIEKESNCSLNFLDITIKKSDNKFIFDIFRKPSFSDSIIPIDSNHSFNIKMSAFNAMIHRLFTVPLSQIAFDKEVRVIKKIANNNGYSSILIDRLIKQKEHKLVAKKFCNLIPINNNTNNYVKLPFIGKISYSIANILKKNCNVKVAFYNKNIMRNILINYKGKNDRLRNSGVYQIKCDSCESVYIGQTGREIKIRFQEHMTAFKNNKDDSAVAKHLKEQDHVCSIQNVKILHVEKKGKRLDLLENLEIERAKKNNNNQVLNDQLQFALSPILLQVC